MDMGYGLDQKYVESALPTRPRAPVAPASLDRPSLSTLIATLFLVAMLFFGLVGFFATWGRP